MNKSHGQAFIAHHVAKPMKKGFQRWAEKKGKGKLKRILCGAKKGELNVVICLFVFSTCIIGEYWGITIFFDIQTAHLLVAEVDEQFSRLALDNERGIAGQVWDTVRPSKFTVLHPTMCGFGPKRFSRV